MSYLDRVRELARVVGAGLNLDPEPDPAFTVEKMLRDEPNYPLAPHERARGWLVTGYANLLDRAVTVNGWGDNPEAYAVALHELGHIATSPVQLMLDPFEQFGTMFGIVPDSIKHYEKLAWEWAVQHVTPDVLDAAVTKSGVSLRSYDIPEDEIAEIHARMRAAAQSHT